MFIVPVHVGPSGWSPSPTTALPARRLWLPATQYEYNESWPRHSGTTLPLIIWTESTHSKEALVRTVVLPRCESFCRKNTTPDTRASDGHQSLSAEHRANAAIIEQPASYTTVAHPKPRTPWQTYAHTQTVVTSRTRRWPRLTNQTDTNTHRECCWEGRGKDAAGY